MKSREVEQKRKTKGKEKGERQRETEAGRQREAERQTETETHRETETGTEREGGRQGGISKQGERKAGKGWARGEGREAKIRGARGWRKERDGNDWNGRGQQIEETKGQGIGERKNGASDALCSMKSLLTLLALLACPLPSGQLLYKTDFCSSDSQGTRSLLAAGYFHTCAASFNSSASVTGQRPVACWGWQEFGQCVTPTDLSDVVIVAAGARHSCAANKGEAVQCWGSNVYGQLELPKPIKSKSCGYCRQGTLQMDPLSKNYGKCVVKTANGADVYDTICFYDCLLSDAPGVIASFSPTNFSSTSLTNVKFRFDGRFMCLPLNVSAGCHHTCVLYGASSCINCNSGLLRCYGSNSHNQSLVPSCPPNLNVAPAVEMQADGTEVLVCPDGSPPLAWLQVSAGMFHTCGLTALYDIVCWGANEYGQAQAPQGLKFKKVSAGAYHRCCDHPSSSPFLPPSRSPQPPSPPYFFARTSLTYLYYGSCGITAGGEVSCWGNNQYRQAMNQTELMAVSNGSNPFHALLVKGGVFVDIACGASHTCAIFLPAGNTLFGTSGEHEKEAAGD
eukprot:762421-Hanusia_phi.AAC.1